MTVNRNEGAMCLISGVVGLFLFLEDVWYELVESAAPGEPFVACACGLSGIDLDAQPTELIHNLTALDKVIATPVHIEIVNLFVERSCIGKYAVVGCLDVEAEDGATECSHPSELVQICQNHVEGLVSTP